MFIIDQEGIKIIKNIELIKKIFLEVQKAWQTKDYS